MSNINYNYKHIYGGESCQRPSIPSVSLQSSWLFSVFLFQKVYDFCLSQV